VLYVVGTYPQIAISRMWMNDACLGNVGNELSDYTLPHSRK
jgi:hypothetical protein